MVADRSRSPFGKHQPEKEPEQLPARRRTPKGENVNQPGDFISDSPKKLAAPLSRLHLRVRPDPSPLSLANKKSDGDPIATVDDTIQPALVIPGDQETSTLLLGISMALEGSEPR